MPLIVRKVKFNQASLCTYAHKQYGYRWLTTITNGVGKERNRNSEIYNTDAQVSIKSVSDRNGKIMSTRYTRRRGHNRRHIQPAEGFDRREAKSSFFVRLRPRVIVCCWRAGEARGSVSITLLLGLFVVPMLTNPESLDSHRLGLISASAISRRVVTLRSDPWLALLSPRTCRPSAGGLWRRRSSSVQSL